MGQWALRQVTETHNLAPTDRHTHTHTQIPKRAQRNKLSYLCFPISLSLLFPFQPLSVRFYIRAFSMHAGGHHRYSWKCLSNVFHPTHTIIHVFLHRSFNCYASDLAAALRRFSASCVMSAVLFYAKLPC